MEWIKVEDGLPLKYEKCLVYATYQDRDDIWKGIIEAYFSVNSGWTFSCKSFADANGLYVTHWMALPKLPKEKDAKYGMD